MWFTVTGIQLDWILRGGIIETGCVNVPLSIIVGMIIFIIYGAETKIYGGQTRGVPKIVDAAA